MFGAMVAACASPPAPPPQIAAAIAIDRINFFIRSPSSRLWKRTRPLSIYRAAAAQAHPRMSINLVINGLAFLRHGARVPEPASGEEPHMCPDHAEIRVHAHSR